MNWKLTRYSPFCLSASLLAVLVAPAQAVDFHWNVAGPADWNVGTNWEPEGPPSGGQGNHAYINNGGTAEISSDIPDIQDIFVGVGVDGVSGALNQRGGNVLLREGSLFVGQGFYSLSEGSLTAETVDVDATTGVFDFTGGMLSCVTYKGNLGQNGGTLSPGSSPGTMTVTGNYSLVSGDLFIELDGYAPGTGYDQLIVTGDVSLAGGLTLDVGFAPTVGAMFTIIDNQGSHPVSGLFSQGSAISAGGYDFGINYSGGDGNDVVLTVVPEPTTLGLLGLGTLLLMARRHRCEPEIL